MTSMKLDRAKVRGVFPRGISAWTHAIAWVALGVATGLLLRAEVVRADLPEGVHVASDLVYREVEKQRLRLDVYEPEVAGNVLRPAIMAIHGGGWRGGSKSDYGRSLLRFVKSGFVLIAADYRLSRPGKSSWPGNLEDLESALTWVRANADRLHIDPRRIAVIGASAGAHLALLLAETTARRDQKSPVIRAVIDFYGPTDLEGLRKSQPRTRSSTDLMIGGTPETLPDRFTDASPIHRVAESHPPTWIVHGSDDLVVPVAQSRSYADSLNASGVRNALVILPNTRHGFGLQAGDRDLFPEILQFLRETWDSPSASPGDL